MSDRAYVRTVFTRPGAYPEKRQDRSNSGPTNVTRILTVVTFHSTGGYRPRSERIASKFA